MNESTITVITCEFSNIYRIHLKNGITLDVFEQISPSVGNMFKYTFNNEHIIDDTCEMNGIVYNINENIHVSFGGLLCNIPAHLLKDIKLNDDITIHYQILHN